MSLFLAYPLRSLTPLSLPRPPSPTPHTAVAKNIDEEVDEQLLVLDEEISSDDEEGRRRKKKGKRKYVRKLKPEAPPVGSPAAAPHMLLQPGVVCAS